jgi:hypothetical protein
MVARIYGKEVNMARDVGQRFGGQEAMLRTILDSWASKLRVSIPGIIQSFDPITQTATVQPAIKENIIDEELMVSPIALPVLLDVPVYFPGGGGFVVTFPITKGDECLVVFSDMCIDGWWANGGIQSQVEKRRHDLSDAIAFVGIRSVPKKVINYSTTSTQLRNEEGTSYIEIAANGDINFVGNVKINGIVFSSHKHSGVTTGTSQTGGPV